MTPETILLATAIVGLGSVAVNVLLVTLVAKLYTEYFKDMSAKHRKKDKGGDDG